MAERAGIEPAIDGIIRPLLVLKTSRNTSSILSGLKYYGRKILINWLKGEIFNFVKHYSGGAAV